MIIIARLSKLENLEMKLMLQKETEERKKADHLEKAENETKSKRNNAITETKSVYA